MSVVLTIAGVRPLESYYIVLVIGLLLYWNTKSIASHFSIALEWTFYTTEIRSAFGILAYWVEQCLCLRSVPQAQLASMGLLGSLSMFIDAVGLALYTGSASSTWTGATTTRVLLGCWVARTWRWYMEWQQCSVREHMTTCMAAACITACSLLQWSYYTTLPDSPEADSSGALLKYAATVHSVSLGLQSFAIVFSCLLRWFGYRLLNEGPRVVGVTQRSFENTIIDPDSDEFRLYGRYGYYFILFFVTWYCSPASMPLLNQLVVLVNLYMAVATSRTITAYKALLHSFPEVTVGSQELCNICLGDFAHGVLAKQLPCGHVFHGPCIRKWLLRKNICPTCRRVATQNVSPAHAPQPQPDTEHSQQRTGPVMIYMPATARTLSGSLQPLAPRMPYRVDLHAAAVPPMARDIAEPRISATHTSGGDTVVQSPTSSALAFIRRQVAAQQQQQQQRPPREDINAQLTLITTQLGTVTEQRRKAQAQLAITQSAKPEQNTIDDIFTEGQPLTATHEQRQQHKRPRDEDATTEGLAAKQPRR